MNLEADLEKQMLLYQQARTSLLNRNVQEAEKLLFQSVETNPTFLPAYSLLEWMLDAQGRTDEAVLIHSHAQWMQLAVRLLEDT